MSNKELDDAVKAIYDAVNKAERIAEETGESFSLEIEYGMGGYYNPKRYVSKAKAKEMIKQILDDGADKWTVNSINDWMTSNFTDDDPEDKNYLLPVDEYGEWMDREEAFGWRSSSSNC